MLSNRRTGEFFHEDYLNPKTKKKSQKSDDKNIFKDVLKAILS